MKYILTIIFFLFSINLSNSDDYLKSWIPSTCCVTNDCCWEIQENELRELPNQEAEVKSTGQIKRYEFSPDGKYYRCACDFNNASQEWVKHQGANTRCLFIPNRGS